MVDDTGTGLQSAATLKGQWTELEETELRARLQRLMEEHRDLDIAIEALTRSVNADMLTVARLKKRKLALKDEIGAVTDILVPDIIA